MKSESAEALKTIFIGGGTPSLLSGDCLRRLFECLRENYSYSSDIEITMEANPGTITRSGIDILRSLGVNRISMGIQSFDDSELKALGRIHNSAEARKSVEIVREAGIENLSLDLMYGIPGQTLASWQETLAAAVGLSPLHISTYELTPEKDTPLSELITAGKITLQEEETVLGMYDHTIDYLSANGYHHYEISNFARDGFMCDHNLNYWEQGEYIGAGAGAHSFIDGLRSFNTSDIETYVRQLNSGAVPETGSTRITPGESVKEFIFLGLRKTEGISLTRALSQGLNLPYACEELIDAGFMKAGKDSISLTRKGLSISNTVIVRTFELLGL